MFQVQIVPDSLDDGVFLSTMLGVSHQHVLAKTQMSVSGGKCPNQGDFLEGPTIREAIAITMSSRKLPDRPTTMGAGGSLADWPKSASDVRRQRLSRPLQKLAMQADWRTNVTRTRRRRMRVDERQNTQRGTLVNRARRRRVIGARTRDEDAGERRVPRDQRDRYVRDVSPALVERVDGLGVARVFSYSSSGNSGRICPAYGRSGR